ncbi:SRPBCC family protein [Nocardia cyriacigeorgica]|jgi:Polyketide cyclase / dehydrase and lipid transport|uniref:SRPBCC family protein n=1 Tax=Nocardia cyriacigeorgica TaxID=135487 RepID=UPI0013D0AFD1|nr:SRPBCC family protein [Nocardia cyriacigeorgica]MBF6436910.1 SRPBCC family protein [Nocardia cyriacigeorgica]MBF6452478.1 SRPBCC family protein [Nocardia cyriacigeorgica]MBF6476667.1 SRPBCC family protein [Nocardia cyriacigeorgica]MBF6549647.1 SRPBCC family protein [Nocardia cyriacigeorgica]NEW26276.1 SRPBCC family protein [Nocardia cyriacigeorgica]
MTEVEVTVPVPIDQAFAALADGWLYASWVVGASHIRVVDRGWPAVGTRIHHSVGLWPLTMQDVTKVTAVDPPYLLELDAHLWLIGAAWIRFDLDEPQPNLTRIRMSERASRGVGSLIPGIAQNLFFAARNQESLDRLAHLIIGRAEAQP